MASSDLPILNLYSTAELERLVLIQALLAIGVEDPPVFIEENAIEYKCALKGNVGMAITISKIAKKAVKPSQSNRPEGG